ncbi:MAG: cytidylyltransferase domain-containing protein [Sulfitobacter sp.]
MSDLSTLSPGDTACLILARGGSKGVPGKNLRAIGGISLIGRSVRAGRAASRVSDVYVSTDDSAIAAEARLHGAKIIDRPVELARDSASSEAGWLHAVPLIRREYPKIKRLVFLQCTSPFTTGEDIDGCLNQMESRGAACALSVLEDHSFLWGLDENGLGVGANHDERDQRKRRQDLPTQFCESGAIYCVQVEDFEKTGRRFCGPAALFEVDHPPIEIDTEQDLALCSHIEQSSCRSPLPDWKLQKINAIVMDFDGVHTDNLVLTDQNGAESVRTSRGDGMGISMLRETGLWHMMILSKERNPVVLKRAEKLKLEVHYEVDDKVQALREWLAVRNLNWANLLYVGNDLNDYAAMELAGVSVCPSDAHPAILGMADWILPLPGGKGALRRMSEILLARVS